MTEAEKIAQVVAIQGCDTAKATAYLALAKSKMLDYLCPFLDERFNVSSIPDCYAGLQIELAIRGLQREGMEGEQHHTEEGTERRFFSADDSDLLSRMTPFAHICTGKTLE